ncbi:hypothetical protein J7337_010345 [Fusarium musae]|uniref:Uncharacterized protein n=1 Tax=Fusarium musae TaxID=1042133 RepID=A0A9P8D8W5_9HYPO|nr:hypothetical protein J7337_010345 [Fusarium musae]KAG9497484.1 hypothetical protein J7337_010345 [Fusarium musae]
MDNKTPAKKDSLTIQELWRRMNQPIILTHEGPMLPGDPSTLQKVPELKATALVAGNILCGLRLESPSGETGNMVAPSDLWKDAIIYQGDTNGERPAIESSKLLRRNVELCNIPLPITSKRVMDKKLPAGYRKVEIKFSFVDPSEGNSQSKGLIEIQDSEVEKAFLMFGHDKDNHGKSLMLEEVVDGGEATAEIIRAANVDRPDNFWPEVVPELNFFVGFGSNKHWNLQFEPPAGAQITNGIGPSDVCPGAMVYFGTKEGIRKAFLTASFLSNGQNVFLKVISVSQDLKIVSRTANLRLRVADINKYVQLSDVCPTYPLESSGQLAVLLLPYRKESESASCGYKVEKKVLVLEAAIGEASKGGYQLGHIKAAQMNGKGQHVFFGPLESI